MNPNDIHESKQPEDTWNTEVAKSYDTPGIGIFAPEVVDPAVERLAELAGRGRAIEFAIGTGRIAIPLSRHGIQVVGIELFEPMVDQLRTKVDETTIPVVIGDMATAQASGKYTVVYLVFNTITNLLTQEAQVACFKNAARHLEPGGRFVIELGIPGLRQLPSGQRAVVFESDPGYVGLDTYNILHQRLTSHHFTFSEDGGTAKHFQSSHRYIWPSELDLMAQIAGFELESRHADWRGSEFTAESTSHVSVYRLAKD